MTDTPIDYTSRDFAAMRASMLRHGRTLVPEWQGAVTGDPNDFGVLLVEMFAYQGDILSYYQDRVANESFLATATQRGSVLRHARHLGYTPRSATAAVVTLDITVTTSRKVIVPAFFQVATQPGAGEEAIVFETIRDLEFPASSTPTTLQVEAVEGRLIEDEVLGTSAGEIDSSYVLSQRPVISDSVRIRVVERPDHPGLVWTMVDNLLDVPRKSRAYSYTLGDDDEFSIQFGDNVNGRSPRAGAVIHARYRVGGGLDGNVVAGSLTEIVDPTDVVYLNAAGMPVLPDEGDQPPLITVTNPAAAEGGADAESIESIRVNTPRAVRTQERAVSLVDYEELILVSSTVRVAKARAVGQVWSNITLYVAPPGGGMPGPDLLGAVVDYFGPRKMAGVSVVAATPTYVPVDIDMQVEVHRRYNQADTRQAVRRAVRKLLSFESVNFGQRFLMADLYAAAREVEGVTNVVVSKLARSEGTGVQDINVKAHELLKPGLVKVKAVGGVVNTAAPYISEDTPAPSSVPTPGISLIRCDPNSTHVELDWTPVPNATAYDVQVSFVKAGGVVVQTTVYGPFEEARAELDLPFIGADRAADLSFRVRAYIGAAGPYAGSPATTAYTCE